MSYCRRARTSGGSYFFTVVTYRRQPLLIHPESRRILGEVIQRIRQGGSGLNLLFLLLGMTANTIRCANIGCAEVRSASYRTTQ